MFDIHDGMGMLVPLFGILAALLMNILTIKIFGDFYYQEHRWPKVAVLLLAAASCWMSGKYARKKRLRDAEKERLYIESLSPKVEAVNQLAFSGPRDHLMFIPLQYWSFVYF